MENVPHLIITKHKVHGVVVNSLISDIRKWCFLLLALVISINVTYSQKKTLWDSSHIAKNSLYLEFLGNGGLYSINYDRILFSKKGFKISARAGISYLPPRWAVGNVFYYPLEVNFMYGKKKSQVEIGIGYTPIFDMYPKNMFIIYDYYSCPNLRLGYRLQNPKGGFYFRTGVLLLFQDGLFPNVQPINPRQNVRFFVNLFSIGYTFKNKQP